jgi:hypothetical protein
VKVRGRILDAQDADVHREPEIERSAKRGLRQIGVDPDAGHLPERVHAGIGPARPRHGRRRTGDGLERTLDQLLDRNAARLPLPADVVRAVVLKNQLQITRAIRV